MSNSVITLLSDLGTRDASVTVAKAILLRHAPGATIIDISHRVMQYDLQQAAYLLLSSYKHFPADTVHITAVDIFGGNEPQLLLAEKDGQYFIAPDNGLLPLAFGAEIKNVWQCNELSKPYSFADWITIAGETISVISAKNISLKHADIKITPRMLQPRIMADGVECNILYIDSFGNVVLDITKEQFNTILKGKQFRIKVIGVDDITSVSNHYSDVPEDEPLCLFNDAGFLEIALNRASVATLLGLGVNNSGNLRYKFIKIHF